MVSHPPNTESGALRTESGSRSAGQGRNGMIGPDASGAGCIFLRRAVHYTAAQI